MKKSYPIVFIAIALTVIMILTGCNGSTVTPGGSDTDVTPGSSGTDEKITLNVLSQRVEDKVYYDAIIEDFQNEYSNITVKLDLIPTAQYSTIVTTRISTDAVDVLVASSQISDPDTRTTLFLNLKGQSFVENVFEENILADFLPGVDTEGDIYVLPIVGTTMLTFYNKTIYNDLGLDIPATWNELISNCDKIKDADINPFLFGGKDQWPVNMIVASIEPPLVQAVKPDFYKTLGTGATKFTDPEFVSIFSKLDTLYKNYFDSNSLGIAYGDAPGLFVQGKSAMLIDGNWSAAQIKAAEPSFEVGTFILPSSDDATANQTAIVRNGMGWSVIKSSPNKDAALKWMEFIFRPENQKLACDVGGMIPVGPNIEIDDALNNSAAALISNATKRVPMFDEGGVLKYYPGVTFSYTPYVMQMLAGELTPEQVAQKLQQDFDDTKPN